MAKAVARDGQNPSATTSSFVGGDVAAKGWPGYTNRRKDPAPCKRKKGKTTAG